MTTNKTSSKSTKKILNKNTQIVKRLALKYGVSAAFVYQSISGDRISPTSETIKKDYKTNLSKINKILDSIYDTTGMA